MMPTRRAWFAFVDVDGTAVDETRPERERFQTLGPAASAVRQLEHRGIPVGVFTGRSAGEALHYAHALGCSGTTIAEDGAVILVPEGRANTMPHGWRRAHFRRHTAYVHPSGDLRRLGEFVRHVHGAASPGPAPLMCQDASATELIAFLGFEDEARAELCRQRLATTCVLRTDARYVARATAEAPAWDLRCSFATPLHIGPARVDKATALEALARASGNGGGTFSPIVFGNNHNDLTAFGFAERTGGLGVLVPTPGGDFLVDTKKVPPLTLRTSAPYGHGLLEALPHVLRHAFGELGPE
jgi:hydroxymethylpyrimidine pyrophosphatase-like HAD family hydrolase